MIDAVVSEWIKLRTLTANWVLFGVAIAFPLLITLLTAALAEGPQDARDLTEVITGTSIVSALLLGTIAVLNVTNEFSHGTIRPTFAALPDRWRTLTAKPILQIAVTLVTVAVVIVVGWTAGAALADGEQDLGGNGITATLVGLALLAIGLTILGYGLGLLVRNTALALCILLLWPLVVEGLLAGLLAVLGAEGLQRWLPYTAGFSLITIEPSDDQLSRVGGGLWFFLWVAVLGALGVWSTHRRDA